MKVKGKRILILVLVALIVAIAAISLVACNDKRDEDVSRRTIAVNSIRDVVLSKFNEDWTGEMSDGELLNMDSAGEYVVSSGWAELILKVVKDSSLQTAKLEALGNAFNSQDADKLFDNFSENAELLIPLLRSVGFTQSDVSNLVYDLLVAVVDKGEETLDAMFRRLQLLINDKNVSLEAKDSLNASRASVNSALTLIRFSLTPTKKQQTLDAFKEARGAFEAVVAFAYNMSLDLITDELNSAIFGSENGAGALQNISDGELSTIVRALLSNVSELKSAVEGENTKKLSNALARIIDAFDVNVINSALYAQIVSYAKYANMVVELIPTICDVITYAGEITTDEGFFDDLKLSFAGDDTTKLINVLILSSRAIVKVAQRYDAASLKQIFDDAKSSALHDGRLDEQRAVPMYALALTLNLSKMLSSAELSDEDVRAVHPEVWGYGQNGVNKLMKIASMLGYPSRFEKFKQAYYEFNQGQITFYQLYSAFDRCSFETFGVEGKYAVTEYNYSFPCPDDNNKTLLEAWYEDYINRGNDAVRSMMTSYLDLSVRDINLFIEDYYGGEGTKLEEFAKQPIFEGEMTEDEAQSLMQSVRESGVMGIAVVIMLLMFL